MSEPQTQPADINMEHKPDDTGKGSEKVDPHAPPTKFEKYWTAIGAVIALITMIMAAVAFAELHGYVNDYKHVIDSWEDAPIVAVDIRYSSSCLTGWEKVDGRAHFPGIYPACVCTDSSNNRSSETSSCNYEGDGCITWQSKHPFGFDIQLFPDYTICAQRAGVSALDRPTYDGSCPSNYHVCGGTEKYCAPQGVLCPLTDIYLSDQVEAIDYENMVTIGTTPPYYLYTKTTGLLNNSASRLSLPATNLPITSLTFQPGLPCYLGGCGYSRSGQETAYYNNYAKYNNAGWRLMPDVCAGGCKSVTSFYTQTGEDTRYVKGFTVNEKTLFDRWNAAQTDVKKVVPAEFFSSSSTDRPYQLASRSEIKWVANCPRSRSSVKDKETSVSTVDSAQSAALAITIISFIICTLGMVILVYWLANNESWRKSESYPKYRRWMKYFGWCFRLGTLVALAITVALCMQMLGFWDDVSGKDGKVQCSDNLTGQTFLELGDKFTALSKKDATGVATGSAQSLMDLIQAFFHC